MKKLFSVLMSVVVTVLLFNVPVFAHLTERSNDQLPITVNDNHSSVRVECREITEEEYLASKEECEVLWEEGREAERMDSSSISLMNYGQKYTYQQYNVYHEVGNSAFPCTVVLSYNVKMLEGSTYGYGKYKKVVDILAKSEDIVASGYGTWKRLTHDVVIINESDYGNSVQILASGIATVSSQHSMPSAKTAGFAEVQYGTGYPYNYRKIVSINKILSSSFR